MKKSIIFGFFILLLVFFSGCSVKKNTLVSRSYHNLTAHYNILFNGQESMIKAYDRADRSLESMETFNNLLPVFPYNNIVVARSMIPDMDKAVKKSSKVIQFHSLTVKPKRKRGNQSEREKKFYEKNEYNRWVDDAYLMMGMAYFYKNDYFPAIESFEYLIKQFKDEPIRFEAYIWLAKVYIQQNKYEEARNIFDILEGDINFPEKLKGELSLTWVDYFLKQNQIEESVPELIKAIDKTKNRRNKARYKFILAQIYEILDEHDLANIAYEDVIKLKPSYEMSFKAVMRRAGLVTPENNDIEAIIKKLNKMLKDDKNIEYKDQIFYALAKIAQNEDKLDLAKTHYLTSTQESINDDHQKGLSFWELGKIYYAEPDYKNAQIFFDSAVSFIDAEFEYRPEMSKISLNLNRLVENIFIVEREDSLQRIAGMNEVERNAYIKQLIDEEQKRQDELKELNEENQRNLMDQSGQNTRLNPNQLGQQGQQGRQGGLGMPDNMGNSTSNWYFYNLSTVSFGQAEFTKKWGRRKLEDNWRRQNKAIIGIDQSTGIEGDTGGYEEISTGESDKIGLSKLTEEYYTEDLPLTDSLIELSNQRIILAMFNIGKVYKDDFSNFPRSIESFENLNIRYPGNEKLLFSYYNLYQLFKESGQTDEEEKYKNLIISEFPDSRSAEIVSNPNYFKELEQERQEIEKLYSATYLNYVGGNYATVLENCIIADSTFTRNFLRPKFSFLKILAMSQTRTFELPDIRTELIELIGLYPSSEINEPAKLLLNFIRTGASGGEDVGVVDSLTGKVKDVDVIEAVPEVEIYSFDPDAIHYYLLLVQNAKTDINRLQFNIENFNTDYYTTGLLQVSHILLNQDMQIVTVKKFEAAELADNYLKTLITRSDILKDFEETEYRHFIISKDNYPVFYRDKDISKYLKFYRNKYQNIIGK